MSKDTDKKILAAALVALVVAFLAGTKAGILPKAAPAEDNR